MNEAQYQRGYYALEQFQNQPKDIPRWCNVEQELCTSRTSGPNGIAGETRSGMHVTEIPRILHVGQPATVRWTDFPRLVTSHGLADVIPLGKNEKKTQNGRAGLRESTEIACPNNFSAHFPTPSRGKRENNPLPLPGEARKIRCRRRQSRRSYVAKFPSCPRRGPSASGSVQSARRTPRCSLTKTPVCQMTFSLVFVFDVPLRNNSETRGV
ncbi:hypothetical protein WN48_09019 [Eufriesea mexicana]|nr:hypothetical protein WN48_09019 [Eufriesea mexicana]